jgi:hypothetical protein
MQLKTEWGSRQVLHTCKYIIPTIPPRLAVAINIVFNTDRLLLPLLPPAQCQVLYDGMVNWVWGIGT